MSKMNIVVEVLLIPYLQCVSTVASLQGLLIIKYDVQWIFLRQNKKKMSQFNEISWSPCFNDLIVNVPKNKNWMKHSLDMMLIRNY